MSENTNIEVIDLVTPMLKGADISTDPLWMSGEKPKYGFWELMAKAEESDKVKATIKALMDIAVTLNNWRFYAELAVALNHRAWVAYEVKDMELAKLYTFAYEDVRNLAYDNLSEEDSTHYWNFTD